VYSAARAGEVVENLTRPRLAVCLGLGFGFLSCFECSGGFALGVGGFGCLGSFVCFECWEAFEGCGEGLACGLCPAALVVLESAGPGLPGSG
jgi:hypothetical protein